MEFRLREIINPYRPGEIPDSKKAFFGREEIVTWLEQQIIAQRRLLILHGPLLIGKTTFIHFLPEMLTLDSVLAMLPFSQLPDGYLDTILSYLIHQLTRQLTEQGILTAEDMTTVNDAVSAIDYILTLVQKHRPDAQLLLIIDDFDYLLSEHQDDMLAFLDVCQTLLGRHSHLHCILTIDNVSLPHLHHPLLDSAPTQQITPLNHNDALQMVTRPVQKIIRFDYGVPKRISDLNSNHPHYLTLFNHTLFSHCAREGWVNLRHLDETLDIVLDMHIPSFQTTWHEATWVERVVLSAMGSVKGTHGLFTRQEIIALLTRKDKKADQAVILAALEALSQRGVLVKMGALSYKFYIDLFRFWLEKHFDLDDVLKNVVWQEPKTRPETPVPQNIEEANQELTEPKPVLKWPLWVLGLIGLTSVGFLLLGFAFLIDEFGISNTPIPTLTPFESAIIFSTATLDKPATPTITLTPIPTKTATPTPPVVVAKSLPSIAYMARQGEESVWQIYVMNTDGSGARPVLDSSANDTSPVWSPDGNEIAFVSQRDGNREIYIADVNGQNLRNFSNHPSDDWTPAWSPDGSQLVFSSNRHGHWEIFVADINGENLQQITNTGNGNISPVWSPDSEWIAFSTKRDGNWEIYRMRPDGTDLRRLTNNEINDLAPIWSPSGDSIAYESNVEDNVEIFVMSATGGTPRNISNATYANDHGPVWSPGGERLIFYSNRDGSWDIFSVGLDGSGLSNLTNTINVDEQTPVWRP